MNKANQKYYAQHPEQWPTYVIAIRIAFEHKSFDEEVVSKYGGIWEDLRLMHKKNLLTKEGGAGYLRRIRGEMKELGWNEAELMSAEEIARIVLIQAYPNE